MNQISKRVCVLFLCVCIFFSQSISVFAGEEIDGGTLYAKAVVLMDADSGRVLFQKEGEKVLPMASTTKIMTCIVTLENTDITKPVEISKRAAGMPDVQLNAQAGDSFYLVDLLYSLMLESHNDSAVAIAEAVAGSVEEFAVLMNQKAKELGCNNTYYITPNGLDASDEEGVHSTTAIDLARIMSYCVNESPQKEAFLKITRTPNYTFHNVVKQDDGTYEYGSKTYSCTNHNAFLQMMEGAESGKTGFTGNAGYCYVGSLEKDGKHLVVSILACGWPPHKTRKWSDVKQLMKYGLENYEHHNFTEAAVEESDLSKVVVDQAQRDNLDEEVVLELSIVDSNEETGKEGILLKEGEKIEVSIELPTKMEAPVNQNDTIGKITYSVGDNVYKVEKIVAKNSVEKVDFKYYLNHVFKKTLLGMFH